jgi:hypothetical protein
MPRALAFRTVYDAFTEPMLYQYYSDDAPVTPGINRFDLYPYYAENGRLTDYRSDRKGPTGMPRPIGSRFGPQNMACCGWALQILRTTPGLWEERYRTQFPQDLRVYFDRTLASVRPDAAPKARLTLGDLALLLSSSRTAFRIQGTSRGPEATLKVFSRPDAGGSYAVVTLRNGSVSAVNDRGEALAVHGEAKAEGEGLRFSIELPYTVAKEQRAAWANGVEQERYSIQAGAATRNLFLASSEYSVKAWMGQELAGGLRTWQTILSQKGFIPTGLGTGSEWDHFSDSGGYAHLISAAAEYLITLELKRDWEMHHIQ